MINICFDLGSDSLKVSYSYKDEYGYKFGKIVEEDYTAPSTISSNAFFNTKTKKWIFGVDADKVDDPRFLHFVNIKKMLSLLIKNKSSKNKNDVFSSNKDYYFNQHYFPYFFFPEEKQYDNKNDYSEKVLKGDVFCVPEYTPQLLCEEYFSFVKSVVIKAFNKMKLLMSDVTISLVYPLRAGTTYINELTRLIEKAFDKTIDKTVCQTKALTILAKHQGKIKTKDNFLVFNIGNEDISVAKAQMLSNSSIIIEGRDGHNEPLDIGGNDIDEAIVDFLTKKNFNVSGLGGKQEAMLLSKQYLLLKNIKEGKYILSSDSLSQMFPEGVPIDIYKDSIVTDFLTKDDLLNIMGISEENRESVAYKLGEYIVSELCQTINSDVNKIFFAGGVCETYGLVEYLAEYVKAKTNRKVEFYTFENDYNRSGIYDINDDNDSTYSSCLGCNLISIENIEIPISLSLSYGTYSYHKDYYGHARRVLNILKGANRGSILNPDGPTEFSCCFNVTNSPDEEFFSCSITQNDITNQRVKGYVEYSKSCIVIGEPNSQERKKVSQIIDLKLVAGGKNSQINLMYKGQRIQIVNGGFISMKEGIVVSPDGTARPFIKNNESTVKYITIKYSNGRTAVVRSKDIEIAFIGVENFDLSEEA